MQKSNCTFQLELVCCKKQQKKFLASYWFVEQGTSEHSEGYKIDPGITWHEHIYNPNMTMGFLAMSIYLSAGGKYCQHPIAVMGVEDMFGLGLIYNQFGIIQVLHRPPIPQTSNWSRTFFCCFLQQTGSKSFQQFFLFFFYRRFRFDSRYDIYFNLSQGVCQGKFSHVSNSISNRKANRKTHGRFWRPYFTSQFFSSLPYTCGLPSGL